MAIDVSVIIPVYNGEQSIKASLDSLAKQTHNRFEAIIINDGSVDRTEEVVERYRDSLHINYYYQENAGVAAARNKGLDLAKGEYVSFLDADDYYEPDFIKKMFLQAKSTESDVCYCGYNVVTPRKTYRRKTHFTSERVLEKYILGKVSVQTTGWMFRRRFLDMLDIKFPIGVSWGEDFEFICETLSLANKTTFVKEYLTNYKNDFAATQLSAFSMTKLDKDFESVKRLLDNSRVNTSSEIETALIEYRLPATLTYRLVEAIDRGVSSEVIVGYYKKYEQYLNTFTWNNRLRSLKLNINKLKLKKYIKPHL